MSRAWVVLLALLAGLGWGAPASAADPEPLTLDAVIGSVDRTHPGLEAAERLVDRAQAKGLAARGAWDPRLAAGLRAEPVGFYDNLQVDTVVQQATPLWGAQFYAGYRLGLGSYPIYKGELQTLSAGELRAGLDVPLWRDGPIDARRAQIRQTERLTESAQCGRADTRLELTQNAARAYWRWVATGQEVRIQRDLLDVAEERDAGLRDQASAGSVPQIVVVDNERLVLDRRSKLVKARQDFQRAVLELSLFLRSDDRAPLRTPEDRVPATIPEVRVDLPDVEYDVQQAVARHPELCALQRERDAAQVEVRYRRNQRAPAINAQAFVSQDLGNGPAELRPAEFGVGLTLEVPLALRRARGEYRAAKADARRIDARIRGATDRIAAEVRKARVDLAAAQQQVELAQRQVEVARTLADAEREKFEEGASDLVIVNLRELAAADAARLEVEARAAHQQARADYLSATGRGL